jgi:hypothetical protein
MIGSADYADIPGTASATSTHGRWSELIVGLSVHSDQRREAQG